MALAEAVGQVGDVVEAELAALVEGASVESEELSAVLRLRERVEALVVLATAGWDRDERWRADGALTPAAWLRAHTSLPALDTARTVSSARLVARNARLAKTLAAGELTAHHVTAMARAVGHRRGPRFDEHADTLIDAARTLDPDTTATMMRRWSGWADDADHRGRPDALHHTRGLWAHPVGDLFDGRIVGHPDDLAALLAALDRLEPPDPATTPGGPRTLAQRRYDALVQLAATSLTDHHGRIDPTHTVNVVIDATTLTGGFDPHGRSDLPGLGPVLPARVQQLLCGSWISRVVTGPDSEILDLGRRARLFTDAQRRAVIARDGGCAIAGCDRPPHWCDIHHLDPYGSPTDGPTDLDNALGLCRPHHTLTHHGWTPTQHPDGTWHLQPP